MIPVARIRDLLQGVAICGVPGIDRVTLLTSQVGRRNWNLRTRKSRPAAKLCLSKGTRPLFLCTMYLASAYDLMISYPTMKCSKPQSYQTAIEAVTCSYVSGTWTPFETCYFTQNFISSIYVLLCSIYIYPADRMTDDPFCLCVPSFFTLGSSRIRAERKA